jgi:hypothetical protein
VRSVRSYQVRSFEVMLAQVSNDDRKQRVFSSMPAEADRQPEQLRGVLRGVGATPATPATILSDGADGPRSLGEAASVGPTRHVLDWFHLSMRIQHVAQAAKGWPDASAEDRKASTRLSETIERIRWRLWHGQVRRGLDLIGETKCSCTEKSNVSTTRCSDVSVDPIWGDVGGADVGAGAGRTEIGCLHRRGGRTIGGLELGAERPQLRLETVHQNHRILGECGGGAVCAALRFRRSLLPGLFIGTEPRRLRRDTSRYPI